MRARALVLAIRVYRVATAWMPPSCRFRPTCSAYAIEAIETHGSWRGLRLALGRIARCHPWGGHGWDPVPPRRPE